MQCLSICLCVQKETFLFVSTMQSNNFCISDTNKNVSLQTQEADSSLPVRQSSPKCVPAAAGLCLSVNRESSSWGSSTADMTDDMRASIANFKHKLTDA